MIDRFRICAVCLVVAPLIIGLNAEAATTNPVVGAQEFIMEGKYREAIELLRPAATRGDARGQLILGNLYSGGHGVPEDQQKAAVWYSLSAEQGDGDAQYSLGDMYYKGIGVLQDFNAAAKWYRLSALHGRNAPAPQYSLGMLFFKGEGVPQDYVSAYMWLNLASANAIGTETQNRYADVRNAVAKSMTSQQISEAQARGNVCATTGYTTC